MDTGLVFALISSVSFAAGIVLVRKTAGEAGESFSVTVLSIYTGILFFAIAIFASGDWTKLQTISWRAAALLASAGVIHFIFGFDPRTKTAFSPHWIPIPVSSTGQVLWE